MVTRLSHEDLGAKISKKSLKDFQRKSSEGVGEREIRKEKANEGYLDEQVSAVGKGSVL